MPGPPKFTPLPYLDRKYVLILENGEIRTQLIQKRFQLVKIIYGWRTARGLNFKISIGELESCDTTLEISCLKDKKEKKNFFVS